MDIRVAVGADFERMIEELAGQPAAQYHVRNRWDVQQRDEGLMLVGPRVVDRWTEQAADGTLVRTHTDECDYLLKPLSGTPTRP